MKRFYMYICLMLLIATSSMAQNAYTISGQIKGLPDGTVMTLRLFSHQDEKPFNKAVLKDGKFFFKGVQKEPRGVFLGAEGIIGSYLFILNNVNINISGKVLNQASENRNYYNFMLKVSGSRLNDLYVQKNKAHDALDIAFEEYHKKFANLLQRRNKAVMVKDTVLLRQIDGSDEMRAYQKADKDFFVRCDKDLNAAIEANKDSWWGPFLMLKFYNYLTKEQRPIYNSFSSAAKNSFYGKLVKAEVYPVDMVGSKIPTFTAKSGSKSVTLKELLAGHKYLLIDFWASWCHPCRKEIPNIRKQYELYANKGLQIVSISRDQDEAAWKKALDEEKLPWPNYRDIDGSIAKAYNVTMIPAIFLVDKDGKLVDDQLRGESLANKLAEVFK